MTTPETVRGVDLAKVDLAVIDAALKASGIRRPRSATLADRVVLMADHDAVAIGGDKKKGGSCDKCGGISLMSRAACPYCGSSDGAPEAVDSKPAVPSPTLAKTTSAVAITTANVKELESVTSRLKGLIGDTLASHWALGRELSVAQRSGVFKYRLGEDRLPVHANFGAYCRAELGLSPEYVRSLMTVAETFTEEQVRDIGVSKLKFIARIPEEVRGELLEKAPELPKRQVEARVQQLSGGKRPPKRKPAEPTRVVAPNEATAVIVPKVFEVRMTRPATGEAPSVAVDLQNGMQLTIELGSNADGLVAIVEFRRVVETTAETAAQ